MRKFLLKILLFSVIVAVCLYGVELTLMSIPNEYSEKRAKILMQGDEIATLLVGHSQMYHGLNPALMGDSVYNAATPLQAPYYDYKLVETYLDDMPNLKCVIWPLCNFLDKLTGKSSGYMKADFNNYTISMLDKYMGLPPMDANRYVMWPELLWSHWKGPAFTRIADNLIHGNVSDPNYNGYSPQNDRIPETVESEGGKKKSDDMSAEDIATNRHLFISEAQMLARVCADNGIRLVILSMPCEYKIEADSRRVMMECMDSMMSVCPSAEYYDYSEDARFVYEDFYDGAHLNDVGAAKFSKLVRAEILH